MILIFSTPTCVYCKQVKRYFDMKGVGYEERDAFTDPAYPDLMKRFGMTVPLVYNDELDRGMIGYNITQLRTIAGLP